MATSFSQELEELLNPLPKFADPEDDHDEATKARVSDAFAGDVDDQAAGVGALRRRNAVLLADGDGRYLGKAVSRQQLFFTGMEHRQDDDDDDEEEDEDHDGQDEEDEDDEIEDDDDDDDDEEEVSEDDDEADADTRTADIGTSGDDDDGNDVSELVEDEEENDDEEEEEVTIATFSAAEVDEEVEKGEAVRNQLAVWERLLEARIKMQKALASANRLPRPHVLPHFHERGGAPLAGAVKNARKALKALQRSLMDLHDRLIRQSSAQVLTGLDEEDDDEDVRAPKRKLDLSDYPETASKRFSAFRPYRDATLQKWHDKTRLSSGKGGGGNFGAFERNVVTQVEQILTDKERLVRRTQTRRSEYRVLGGSEDPSEDNGSHSTTPPGGGKSLNDADGDEDAFDDDDFYHQLLRELIERKTGGGDAADANQQVAAGRQWLQIQKLRSKLKKKVDTKASKGRKVRFDVHAKLLNFMAPVGERDGGGGGLAHDARNELYRGLFGLRPPVMSQASDVFDNL
ncbi:protein AATF [Festucalex cinctus]